MTKNQIAQKLSVVIPAFNEEAIICHVIREALKPIEVTEVIVVNDGSTDRTEEKVLKEFEKNKKFVYLKHKQNKGKGLALKTGLIKAKEEVILFLDADLKNMTEHKIRKIFLPVLHDEVDVSRGAFSARTRRVTDFAVKPMLKILFPDMDLEDPITGQICAKKTFLKKVDFENRYGVDIGLLFDAMEMNQRIVEVDIGKLKTKDSDIETVKEMARQVLETMIKKAGLIQHKYKLVLFALDNTIIGKEGFTWFFKKLGIVDGIKENNRLLDGGKIDQEEYFKRNAMLYKGMNLVEVEKIAAKIPLAHYSQEVINALKKRKYKVAIISANFSPMVAPIAKHLGVDLVRCIYLENKNGILTGELTSASRKIWLTDQYETSSRRAFRATLRKTKIKPIETIVVAHNEKYLPICEKAGLSIAFRPKSKELKAKVDKVISYHAEILAIIE
ncbi:MAG: HAD-IB family phosphatase [Candidatus Berkelbacteria bacterium]